MMGDHTKQKQGGRMIGVGLQYLLTDVFSLGQVTCGEVLHGEVYGVLGVWLDVWGIARGVSAGGR